LTARVVLRIPALHCDGCLASAAQLLQEFPRVHAIEGSLRDKELRVEYDMAQITPAAMSAQLGAFGYPVASASAG